MSIKCCSKYLIWTPFVVDRSERNPGLSQDVLALPGLKWISNELCCINVIFFYFPMWSHNQSYFLINESTPSWNKNRNRWITCSWYSFPCRTLHKKCSGFRRFTIETEMSFWWNVLHRLHRKLSFWHYPVQPIENFVKIKIYPFQQWVLYKCRTHRSFEVLTGEVFHASGRLFYS